MDKAGKAYWDRLWNGASIPRAIDPHDRRIDNWRNFRFHSRFQRIFAENHLPADSTTKLLEVGCARSQWLPYFAREFGFAVTGLDYSEIGCEQSRAILAAENVDGKVVCADFFAPPDTMHGAFDIVVSFGVVEHFVDTVSCVRAFARFLKPGGIIITIIPNLAGIVGALQKRIDRAIYDIHVPLNRRALESAHRGADLSVESCRYWLFFDLGAVNFEGYSHRPRLFWVISRLHWWPSRVMLALDRMIHLPGNAVTSPYILCVAKKLASTA